ncbi:hypothetical protein ABZ471_36950 [Streptomyces sp. NPDC005728]|uniref:hypothetical protein n=1 Tax=Streptomyces sp. NPDC005728 TaxID=3157054 RepID=UPI0033F48242
MYPADGYTDTVEVTADHAYTWSDGSTSRNPQLPFQEGDMTQLRHAHDMARTVADAHGRTVDFMLTGPTSTHDCSCPRPVAGHHPRGRPGAVVIRIAAVLTAGLVASVLLVVVRDIVTTVASTSATGLILRALLMLSNRRGR